MPHWDRMLPSRSKEDSMMTVQTIHTINNTEAIRGDGSRGFHFFYLKFKYPFELGKKKIKKVLMFKFEIYNRVSSLK